MATLHKEIYIDARPEAIWDAARDVGALHTRLVPGFVVDTQLEGNARIVTFGNGMVVRELIISVDDQRRRLAWTAIGGRTTHYNAVLEVLADRSGTRVVWSTDLPAGRDGGARREDAGERPGRDERDLRAAARVAGGQVGRMKTCLPLAA